MARLYHNTSTDENGNRIIQLTCVNERRMLTGWQDVSIGQGRHMVAYFSPVTGNMLTGWNKIDGNWYYFSYRDPYIYTGPITIFGEPCTITPDGMLLGYNGDDTPDAIPII